MNITTEEILNCKKSLDFLIDLNWDNQGTLQVIREEFLKTIWCIK